MYFIPASFNLFFKKTLIYNYTFIVFPSLARINAYRALASPSLIALSSKDPILTAFELSNELKRLSMMEAQFREVYTNLRKQVQELATGLIDHARTSYELVRDSLKESPCNNT